ncbi:MAG: response regulator [Anaerolineae bacterium]|nr:response regulator [Anaerolineae bacterium]
MYTEQNNRDINFSDGSQQGVSTADILIIDDLYDNLALLDQLLSGRGYEVRIARDGLSGLRAAHAQLPDLILLDVRLPQMDGFAVCTELKTADALHDIPVIFVSAVHDVADKLKAFEVGGVDYITKPFQAQEVLARVEAHLALAHLRQQEKELLLMQERQRLARDLHDSVKQTLFMIGSTAAAMQLQSDSSDSKFTGQLDQLRRLSQIALAEMNMMLFELHPRKLAEVDLDILLRQLTESLTGRTQATLSIMAQPLISQLPVEIKVACYRIAQEALSNAIRHADAKHIVVSLVEHEIDVVLTIKDDGVGFDLGATSATGLGLDNMRERAATHSMNLMINTEPSRGTHVKVVWSKDNDQRENTYRSG